MSNRLTKAGIPKPRQVRLTNANFSGLAQRRGGAAEGWTTATSARMRLGPAWRSPVLVVRSVIRPRRIWVAMAYDGSSLDGRTA
jgi:hypothetical protein